ncbi:hypothetical protein RhiTH_010849 [Rhizoctonia solani]
MSSSAEQKTTSFWSTLQKSTLTEASFEYGLKRPTDADYQLPEDSDFLRGVTFNGPNGPYKCSRQVSRLRSKDRVLFEVLFGHIYRGVLSRETIEMLAIFIWDGQLPKRRSKSRTRLDQHEALRDIFAAWGEMVPLCAVIGASLAATGTLGSKQTLTGDSATFRPSDRGPDVMQMIDRSLDITGNFERRFESRIQGGSPEIFSKSGFNPWLTNVADFDNCWTWEVVKVNRGVPIIDILPSKLRDQCARLLSQPNALWRTPAVGAA